MSIFRKQELCLDAIESSFSMARIAYERMIDFCRRDAKSDITIYDDSLLLDAWSFIDVAKRLRSILEHTPGIKNSHSLTAFLRVTEDIIDFRHYIQHMEERTLEVAKTGRPIWGSFSWIYLEPNGVNFKICVYIPGRLAKTTDIPVVNPAGREFHDDIDHFEVTVNNITINLSDMSRKISNLQNQFNAALNIAEQKTLKSGETILSINIDKV